MSLAILRRARQEGIIVFVEEGRLKFRAKAAGPSEDLRNEIVQNKEALIAFLQQHNPVDSVPHADPHETAGPLSQTQSRVYYHETAFDTGASYVMAAAYRFDGLLDPARLNSALDHIVTRHSILRSRFVSDEKGIPTQEPLSLEATGFRLNVSTDQPLDVWLASQDNRRIDLTKGRVIDVSLLQQDGCSHLHVACHHIVFDGWSYGCFFNELATLYQMGHNADLHDLPFQYVDYARWQSTHDMSEASRTYWRDTLAGVSPLNGLKPDFARAAQLSFAGQNHQRIIPAPLVKDLKILAQQQGVSLYSALLAVFSLVISRYTQNQETVVGTPVAGRADAEVSHLIGLFANVIPLRMQIDHDQSFAALLAQVQRTNVEGQAYQDLHFEQIVQELGFAGQSSFTPLCQIIFSFDEGAARQFSIGDLPANKLPIDRSAVNFELELHLIEEQDGTIFAVWAFAEALFAPETIDALADAFDVALQRVLAHPEAPLRTHTLASADFVENWHPDANMPTDCQTDQSFADLFEGCAASAPDSIACVWRAEDGSVTQRTYAELNAQANGIAHALLHAGAKVSDCIAVPIDHGWRNVVALLAVQKTGAAHVVVDPATPIARNKGLLAATGSRFVIGDANTCAAFDDIEVIDWDVATSGENPDRAALGWTHDATALVVFTSGSTGTPKGIMIDHPALTNYLLAGRLRLKVQQDQCFSVASTLTFDAHMLEIFLPLAFGARLALFDPTRFRDGRFLKTEQDAFGIDAIFTTPTSWQVLLDEGWHPQDGQTLMTGGEMLPQALSDRLLSAGNDIRLVNVYGPSECTTFVLTADMARGAAVHVGWPTYNSVVEIVDDYGNLCPAMCEGELVIGGAQVARGYLNGDGQSANRFGKGMVLDPNTRHYRSGDQARRWPDGRVEIIGRKDFQVKHNGVRIELGEIETALLTHNAVTQAVAIVRPSAGGQTNLLAYVQATLDPNNATEVLRAHMETCLPRSFIPSSVTVLKTMPLTPSGKIDRGALPDPVFTVDRPQAQPPTNATQRRICDIWSEVTGQEVADIAANFFAIGGHSLLAIKMLNRVNRAFETPLLLRDVVGDLTVGKLAAAIGRAVPVDPNHALPILPTGGNGPAPLSFSQERIWAIDRIDAFGRCYTIPLIFDVDGPLDPAQLSLFLDQMLAQHAILRTCYRADNTQEWQTPMPPQTGVLQHYDATMVDDSAAMLNEVEYACLDAPFNLMNGPIVRSSLVRLSPARHRWFLAIHHIAFDGRSLEIFLDALRTFLTNQKPPTAPEVSFADFAKWQVAQYDVTSELSYWQSRLAGCPQTHALTLDRPRPPNPTYQGATFTTDLDAPVTAKLRTFAQNHSVTEFSVLCAGFAAYLCGASQQSEILIGTPVANRTDPALDQVIGNFVNTVALRMKPKLESSFGDLAQQAHRDIQMDMAHQAMPFEKLVQAISPTRSFTHSPVFQIMIQTDNSNSATLSIGDTHLTGIQPQQTEAKFDLTLGIRSGDTIGLSWNYATDIFDAETVQRYADEFLSLLRGVLTEPDQPVAHYLPKATHRSVDGPKRAIDQTRFADRFRAVAVEYAAKPALFWHDQSMSYGDLYQQAEALCDKMHAAGIGPASLVAVHLSHSFDMVTAVLAVHLAGAAHMPLDPSLPSDRLAAMVDDACPALVISDASPDGFSVPVLDVLTGSIRPGKSDYAPRDVTGETAYVIYTSGSTGQPKGVEIHHTSLCNFLDWVTDDLGVASHDTVLHVTSLSFDIALTEIFGSLCTGAALVLTDTDDTKNTVRLGQLIETHDVTVLQMVPSLLHVLTDSPLLGTLNTVRHLLCGGEAVSVGLMHRARRLFPAAQLRCVYGPTEATIWASVHVFDGTETGPLVPIGLPLPNVSFSADGDTRHPQELRIGGDALAAGYLHDPVRTESVFVTAAETGLRSYKSGDLVTLGNTGRFQFCGRTDTQIKLHGYRIELSEIEAALLRNGAVRAVCLLRNEQIIAYVDIAAPDTLSNALRGQLPAYMVPALLVQVTDFPLTPNAKIDRVALAKMPLSPRAPIAFEAPQGEIELTLAEIWQDELERPEISRHDNFFAIGGHSLRAIRVAGILRDMLETEVPVRILFEHPTIAALATYIDTEYLNDDARGDV